VMFPIVERFSLWEGVAAALPVVNRGTHSPQS
jgi:hypothetical protein